MKERRKKRRKDIRILLNKFKSEKSVVRLVSLGVVLVILCFIIGIFHSNRIFSSFQKTSYDYIFDRAQVTSRDFSSDFQRKGNIVRSEAVVLEEVNTVDKESICNCLKALENSGEFDYARYISNRGVKYKAEGNQVVAAFEAYDEVVDGVEDYMVYENFEPEISVDEICFAASVKSNGLVQGYLIGIVRASKMFEGFDNSSSTSVAERYLVDDKGMVVIYARGEDVFDGAGKNMYSILTSDCLDDFDAEVTRDDIINQLNTQRMANREITIKGRRGFVLFKELSGTNGWSLFYIVYDEDVQSIINPILIESVGSIIVIMFLMIFLATAIIRYLSNEQKKMYALAYVDELTAAPNENAFIEKTTELLKEFNNLPYVIMSFDIVNFRYINEGYGHEKADMILRSLAKALSESYGYNETYARLDADHFIGLCIDDGRLEERRKFITDRLKDYSEAIGMRYPIRMKTGLYYVRSHKEPVSDMIDKANLARKSVDGSDGRNLEAEYREQLMENTRRQEEIESKMESALQNGEFIPYLQPKWDMERDCICGAEALIRWKTKEGKIVPPGDFIPLFEKNGFVEKIDFYMLEEICKYIRRMLDENKEVYPVSINQSRYLMYDPNYLSRVQEIMLRYKVPRGLVELELTETVFFQDKSQMIEVMNRLKEMNMELSIDDFGSGYSSLNILRDIPFDVLKIDRGFLDESSQSEEGKWILRKIVEMAEGLHMRVICEGVETQEQAKMLLGIGCRYAQGYLYSRPIPMDEFIEKYDIVIPHEERYYFDW